MAEPAPGTLIGGEYRLTRPLGAGGMGVVWVAEQLSTGSLRAVKLLRPELVSDDTQLTRFLNEARIGARIPSDHVVQVLGAGHEASLGVPWLAMELLEGVSLGSHLRSVERMHPADAFEVMGQLCHALAAGHARGIVHRDVKPENVFLSVPRREGARFTVKVLDFGIAKLISPGGQTTTAPLGSPAWMAPEQTEAHTSVTPATDVWALGLLVFRMLTGKPFWMTPQQAGSSITALMREILLEPIPPATARAAALGCSEWLPPGFDAWFASCVCRDATRRFQDAQSAKQALDALMAQWEPVRHSPDGAFAFGDIPHHTVGFALASTDPQRHASGPTAPITPRGSMDQMGTSMPISFGRTASPTGGDPRFSPTNWAPRPGPSSRAPILVAVLGGGALVGLLALGAVAWKVVPGIVSAGPYGLPVARQDIAINMASVQAGSKEPGTYIVAYTLTTMSQSAGLTFGDAGDRCHAADKYGSGSSLCSPAQWRIACRENKELANKEAWMGSLTSATEALVCGGNGSCESCRNVAIDDTSSSRFGPCCNAAPLIRNKNPARELAPAEALSLTMLHGTRYSSACPMLYPYFAPNVDWYDSKGLTPEQAKDLVRTHQAQNRGDWSVDEECTASEVTGGPVVLTHECRRTVRMGKELAAVITRMDFRPLTTGSTTPALSAIRDSSVLFRATR